MEARAIAQWALRADPYAAPELGKVWLTGVTPDNGRPISTNYVIRKVAPLTYETKSGSLYRIEGPPEEGYATHCRENGITIDPADPIKFQAKATQAA